MLRLGMMTENIIAFKNMYECLDIIKECGYECADISFQIKTNHPRMVRFFEGKDYKEHARLLKEHADRIGLPLVQAHAPFPVYNPLNNNYNKRMFIKLVKCIEMCGIMKIKNLVIHPWNDFPDELNVEFFNKLLPYAIKNDVIICTENMWRWNSLNQKARPCACSFPDSFKNVVDGVNSPHLKACVDIGHAQMFNHLGLTPRQLLEELNDRVYCLHIHDNDGSHDNHWAPYTGVIDYKDVSLGLKNINYKNDLIIETNLPNGCNSIDNAKDFFKEQLESLKKIKNMITN